MYEILTCLNPNFSEPEKRTIESVKSVQWYVVNKVDNRVVRYSIHDDNKSKISTPFIFTSTPIEGTVSPTKLPISLLFQFRLNHP